MKILSAALKIRQIQFYLQFLDFNPKNQELFTLFYV